MKLSRSAIKKSILDEVISSQLFWAFFILTISIVIVGGMFQIPGVVDHPQFGSDADPKFIKEILKGGTDDIRYPIHLKVSYYLFFIIDVFWALSLLLILRKFIKQKINDYPESFPKYSLQILGFLIVIAYAFDLIENYFYVFCIRYIEWIEIVKMVSYFLVAISFVFSYLRYFVDKLYKTYLRFLKSSLYSLVVLVIIGLLLPKAPQVNSIVVDLYMEPWNMAILLFIGAPFFAIVLAHYPSYFKVKKDEREWFMAKGVRFIFGIVYYRYTKKFLKSKEGNAKGTMNFLFRLLGICFYAALFYMIAYSSEVNFNWPIRTGVFSVSLLLAGILWMYRLKEFKDNWYTQTYKYLNKQLPFYYDGDHTLVEEKRDDAEKDIMDELKSINGPIMTYISVLAITILTQFALVLILVFCESCRYTELTVFLSLFCIILQTVCFVYYRVFRSVLKFPFFNENSKAIMRSFLHEAEEMPQNGNDLSDSTYESDKEKLKRFFENHDFKGGKKIIEFLSWIKFGAWSDNVFFLKVNAIIGIVNTVFFLIINSDSTWSIPFNAVLIIMSALFLFYGILVVLTKTIIYYYYSKERYAEKYRYKFLYIATGVITVMIGLNIVVMSRGNNLFTLQPLARTTGNEISLSSVKERFDKQTSTRYYIGCYGGGMKSNAWTMTVLNRLYEEDNTIFKKTVGISGASGGTMGLINMLAITKNVDKEKWKEVIKEISTENILSLDLTHTLGRDSFYKLFNPKCDLSEYDRSTKAMDRYAYLVRGSKGSYQKTPFREYWSLDYDSATIKYPILIANSTNVKGKQGMAVSVRVDNASAEELLYHGADDILELKNVEYECCDTIMDDGTLDFYDAASTSNRFPLISPAARIETKGHFNDGGIYENSGMLSAYKLFQAMCDLDSIEDYKELKQKNVFINIVNDKNQYIRKVLEDKLCEIREINNHTELSSLLSSVASTEMMPRYIKDKLKRMSEDYPGTIEFESIYLPHRFTVEDVKSIYGKQIACAGGSDSIDEFLYGIVYENNRDIETMVKAKSKWGSKPIIEPPMSRVMTESAYIFMDTMLEHEMTLESLRKLGL